MTDWFPIASLTPVGPDGRAGGRLVSLACEPLTTFRRGRNRSTGDRLRHYRRATRSAAFRGQRSPLMIASINAELRTAMKTRSSSYLFGESTPVGRQPTRSPLCRMNSYWMGLKAMLVRTVTSRATTGQITWPRPAGVCGHRHFAATRATTGSSALRREIRQQRSTSWILPWRGAPRGASGAAVGRRVRYEALRSAGWLCPRVSALLRNGNAWCGQGYVALACAYDASLILLPWRGRRPWSSNSAVEYHPILPWK